MKTKPKYIAIPVAAILAMLTLPTIAEDMPAPTGPDDIRNSEVRKLHRLLGRLQSPDDAPKPWRIGLMVEPISDDLREHLDIPENSGVVVTQVVENGPAAEAGIRRNDIITAVNDRPVGSLDALRESVEASANPGKELRLSVISKGVKRVAVIRLPVSEPPMDRMKNGSDAKVRELGQMAERMAEQNRLLMDRMEKQQSEINRMRETIEQLSKAIGELKQGTEGQEQN
jgi:membrane-associated protease RseP (regulator of RpoE activity)